MRKKFLLGYSGAVVFLVFSAMAHWGCSSGKPLSPGRPFSLQLSIPPVHGIQPLLLGVTQNEILYRLDGSGVTLKGTIGPFAASSLSGSIDFAIDNVPAANLLLSLQLNDASTHQALAVGATPFSPVASSNSSMTVQLGSVVRSCYTFTGASYPLGYAYSFAQGAVLSTGSATIVSNYDIQFVSGSLGGFVFQDVSGLVPNDVAYLGNGNLVDFDRVPLDTAFYANSGMAKTAAGAVTTDVQVGDVYCVKLATLTNGHAWVQITSAGFYDSAGPNFSFRVNDQAPYYAYEQTPADISVNGNCKLLCPGILGHNQSVVNGQTAAGVSYLYFSPVTPAGNVTLQGLSIYTTGSDYYTSTSPINFEMGIYNDVGGVPATLMASTSVGSTSTGGWSTLALTNPVVLSGATPYWLAVHSGELNDDASVSGNYDTYTLPVTTYGSLPAVIPSASVNPVTVGGYILDAYGIYCP